MVNRQISVKEMITRDQFERAMEIVRSRYPTVKGFYYWDSSQPPLKPNPIAWLSGLMFRPFLWWVRQVVKKKEDEAGYKSQSFRLMVRRGVNWGMMATISKSPMLPDQLNFEIREFSSLYATVSAAILGLCPFVFLGSMLYLIFRDNAGEITFHIDPRFEYFYLPVLITFGFLVVASVLVKKVMTTFRLFGPTDDEMLQVAEEMLRTMDVPSLVSRNVV